MNGQNRLAAALSFMVGCKYNLQDWILNPASIDPEKALDVHATNKDDDDILKVTQCMGKRWTLSHSNMILLVYIDCAWKNPNMISGVQFFPSMDIRVLSHDIKSLHQPSISKPMESLHAISQKRAVDERMLSNTSMPAKCLQIMHLICDEIVKCYQQCQDFHCDYHGAHMKPSNAFKIQYPDYRSESDCEGTVAI